MRDLGQVERIRKPSLAEWRERIVRDQRPVILEGVIDDWPAMTRWNGAALVELYGELPASVGAHPQTIRQIVDAIRGGGDAFADFTLEQAPALMLDLRPLPYVAMEEIDFANVWMGGARETKLHYDLLDNLHAVVRGQKTFYLVHPREHVHLYHLVPDPRRAQTLSYTQLDFFRLDDTRFPETRNVGYHVAEVHPGEVLYLPTAWYHAVKHAGDPTMAVNFWWPSPHDFARAADSFLHDRIMLGRHYGDGPR